MDKPTIVLTNWWVLFKESSDPYVAPEMLKRCLAGYVTNHPRISNGKLVETSSIVEANGRFITTSSGSIYYLDGNPDQKYLDWMKEQNYPFNSEDPIKIIKGKVK